YKTDMCILHLSPMKEDQTGSDSVKLHVSLAGPNPKHMDDEFLATAYPKVHENLKLITDERVIKENPESHSSSMSSMKNLDDTYNFGDQFLYDKPTENDIMKALKESKKMSKRQSGTGGSNEGSGNILGVPDESTIISRASSEGTGSKLGVLDEKADVDSEHFDRDDNVGDDNEETKPDPEEIWFVAKANKFIYL
ncbi:hypothetical protein Tco_0188072, partial [Tanacetum coccineum]